MHVPVLLQETLQVLNPKPGECFVDGTLGSGGHAREIMRRIGESGTFIGIDRDKRAIGRFKEKVGDIAHSPTLHLIENSYAHISDVLSELHIDAVDGILLDLGFSSDQIDDSEEGGGRGFSFRYDEPLLMTYEDSATPVRELLKELSLDELTRIIAEYGEEKYARRIAIAIKENQKSGSVETTKQLTEIICATVPSTYERGRIHPATRTFMGLRIYANKELEQLSQVLEQMRRLLKPKGRVAIISFHSLEDRIVKRFMKEHGVSARTSGEEPKRTEEKFLTLITKKPIQASDEEIGRNPRSRSAKLRAAYAI